MPRKQTAYQAAQKVAKHLKAKFGNDINVQVLNREQTSENYYGFGADAMAMWEEGPYEWVVYEALHRDLYVAAGVDRDAVFMENACSFAIGFYDQSATAEARRGR